MKPARLVLRAFGPFSEEQVLDFEQLGNRSLFLIHGPTGSGKTTILDAVCFALYGVTSGNEREGKQMRSDHANPNTPTEITFDFHLGSEHYRVTRRPEQQRPKKRGEGNTIEPSQATLWRCTDAVDGGEGTVLASQWSKVTDKIESLLGFRSEQFRQVIMLPQGQFRQFLISDSKDRQQILETLFESEFYRRVEEKLKLDARALEEEIKDATRQRTLILSQSQAESETVLCQQKEEKILEIKEFQERLEVLRQADKESHQRLIDAQQIAANLKEAQEAATSLATLEDKKAEYDKIQVVLERARKASTLIEMENACIARVKDTEVAQAELSRAEEFYRKASEEKDQAEKNLAKERDQEGKRIDAARELARLEDMVPRVGNLEQACHDLAQINHEITEQTRSRNEANDLFVKVQQDLKHGQQALNEAENLAIYKESREVSVRETMRIYDQAISLNRARAELGDIYKKYREAEALFTKSEESLMTAQEEYRNIEFAWHEGQAAILAHRLSPGEPCPVCGSTDHPHLAISDQELPSEAMLNRKRDEIMSHKANRDRLRTELNDCHRLLTQKEAEIKSLETSLGASVEVDVSVIENKLKEAKDALNEANAADSQLLSLKPAIHLLEEKIIQSETALKESEKKLRDTTERQAGIQAIVSERESCLPEDLRDLKALTATRKMAEDRHQSLNKAFEDALKKANESNKECAAAEASLTAAVDRARSVESAAKDQAREFAEKVKLTGFDNEQDYRVAKRVSSVIDQLSREIRRFQDELSAAKDRLERARKASDGLEAPDLAALQEAADKAKDDLHSAIQQETILRTKIEQIQGWLSAMEKASRETKVLEERYAVLGRLAEVANGKNIYGLTFQRFVLATLLDDVLIAATERLKLMSKGRFYLQRIQMRTDKRTAAGLELEVYDTYTGTARPVSTLSGGESFLASLALSLGLADVVQSYAGGIRMETIFVDEGFGSLDPEALDLAFQALADLQQGGRLVGIVSHVPELKERIDVRLEVTSSQSGSTARFVM